MKKKVITVLIATGLVMSVSGCRGVKQSDYDDAMAQVESTQKELDSVKEELSSTKESLANLQTEYDTYKEEMKPFEEMTAAQAEAERVKAEQEKQAIEDAEAQKKAEEEAAAAAAAAEAEAARAAEEAKGYETGITYDQLARTPDDFVGKKVKFYGKVIQVIEGGSTVQIRLAVNEDYDTILLGEYNNSIVSSRVLDDDLITIYGTSQGLISYKSTMGGTITIPSVSIDKIDQ